MKSRPRKAPPSFEELRRAAIERAAAAVVQVRAEARDLERIAELLIDGGRASQDAPALRAAVARLATSRAKAEAAMREAHEAADRAVDALPPSEPAPTPRP